MLQETRRTYSDCNPEAHSNAKAHPYGHSEFRNWRLLQSGRQCGSSTGSVSVPEQSPSVLQSGRESRSSDEWGDESV